jgi:hypothetical protein
MGASELDGWVDSDTPSIKPLTVLTATLLFTYSPHPPPASPSLLPTLLVATRSLRSLGRIRDHSDENAFLDHTSRRVQISLIFIER